MKSAAVTLVLAAVVAVVGIGIEPTWRCVKVIDGDTIAAESDTGDTLRINLFGIDAPELDQPFGAEAKEYLDKVAQGHELELSNTGSAPATITAPVRIDASDLSITLVQSGFVSISQEGDTSEAIAIALFMAQSQGTGL